MDITYILLVLLILASGGGVIYFIFKERKMSKQLEAQKKAEKKKQEDQWFWELVERERIKAIRKINEYYGNPPVVRTDKEIIEALRPDMYDSIHKYHGAVMPLLRECSWSLYYYDKVVDNTVQVKILTSDPHQGSPIYDIVLYDEEQAKKYCNLKNAEEWVCPIKLYSVKE